MVTKEPVNILLVDDEAGKLLSYESILAGLGENLVRAGSAREALDQLLKTDVAVVLVDVCMPELDGFELAAMIRNHPRFEKTSIILVSAVLVDDAHRLKGYGAGAVDYVSVPIVPEILRAKVAVFADLYRKTIELQKMNRELEQRVADRTADIAAALKQAQEARLAAEAADRLKDEFLATLSHELRTPLSAITGWVHLLQTGSLDEAGQKKGLETIGRSARLQGQLISDILDVSRIITGKLRLNREKVSLPSIVQTALDSLRPAADARKIRIEVALPEAEEVILADPARLQQVIWNLVSNAIKFASKDGQVALRVDAVGSRFEMVIEDDGPGIDPEFLPFIFDRFRQADSSSSRPHQGLGLGLAIVRHLVEMHGGRVEAQNRTDRSGAIFKVILPRHVSAVHEGEPVALRTPVPDMPPGPAPSLKGVRVLVVDDDLDGREIVATILERSGAEVRVAGSAGEAIAIVERDMPDVLLADIEMPGEDGYSLLRRIRNLPEPKAQSLPAVALTAYASGQDRAKALSAGFQMHLSKPAHPVELARMVGHLAGSGATGEPGFVPPPDHSGSV
jgi:signal transduction histidine kinase